MHPACVKKLEKSLSGKPKIACLIIRNLYTSLSLSSLTYNDLTHDILPKADVGEYKKDSRISHLEFSDFRTFPSSEEKRYCVDFVKDESPASLFLVGQNGTGKSTLFTALEMISLGRSSFAEDAGIAEDNYLTFSFKRDISKKTSAWKLKYKLGDSNDETELKGNDKGTVNPLSVPAFVCSDLDIDRARKARNLFNWILNELGYGEIEAMKSVLDEMISNHELMLKTIKDDLYLSDDDKWELIKAINSISGKIEINEIEECCNESVVKSKSNGILFPKIWRNKYIEVSDSESDVDSAGNNVFRINTNTVHRLVKLYQKLRDIIPANTDLNSEPWKFDVISGLFNEDTYRIDVHNQDEKKVRQEKQNLEKAKKILRDFEKGIVHDFIANYGMDIEKVLADFSSHHEHYRFDYTELDYIENLSLNIRVNVNGKFDTVPKEYFNTFRYKLFVQTMKMALAFNWMNETGIAAPIVIDDVFNASDFENSIKLESYIHFVKKIYRKICLDNDFQLHLQLIMLTHDDLVFNSVVNGYNMIKTENEKAENRPDRFPFLKGRLFKLEELDVLYKTETKEETNVINVYLKDYEER